MSTEVRLGLDPSPSVKLCETQARDLTSLSLNVLFYKIGVIQSSTEARGGDEMINGIFWLILCVPYIENERRNEERMND